MMKFVVLCFLVVLSFASAFVPSKVQRTSSLELSMKTNEFSKVFAAGIVASSLFFGGNAHAEVDYDGIKYLGGGDKIDLNNANVRAYLKVPGFYPTLAGKIVSGGPFSTVADVYNLPSLTSTDKDTLKKSEGKLTVLPPKAEYVIDKINNGLYR